MQQLFFSKINIISRKSAIILGIFLVSLAFFGIGQALAFEGELKIEKSQWLAAENPIFEINYANEESGFFSNFLEYVLPGVFGKELEVYLVSPDGNKKQLQEGLDFDLVDDADGNQRLTLSENSFSVPGKYALEIKVREDGQEKSYAQDFVWGVLAINPNRSVYLVGEEANFSIGVLDDKGNMVCDAKLELKIKNENTGKEELLTNYGGKIIVHPQCHLKSFSLEPDFEATYKLEEIGKYSLSLTAQTASGVRSITDSIEVANQRPFEIERKTATRIYPLEEYPVMITVSTDQDFSGEITEEVPESFSISAPKEGEGRSFDSERTGNGRKILSWKVDLKKGERLTLGYQYDAPDISPEFYLLGPLRFSQANLWLFDSLAYEEPRQWQIASDAPSTVVDGTSNSGTVYPMNRRVVRTNNGANKKRTFVIGYDGSDMVLYYSDNPEATSPTWSTVGTLITTTTHYVGDMVWHENGDNDLYVVYGPDAAVDANNGSESFFRRVTSLGTTPSLGAQYTALDSTNSVNYTKPTIEIAGDSSTEKLIVLGNRHSNCGPCEADGFVVVTGTIDSDNPSFAATPTDIFTGWATGTSRGLLGVSRVNTNKLVVSYYDGANIYGKCKLDSADAETTTSWDQLDCSTDGATTVSADDPGAVGVGSVAGDDNSDVVWFSWIDGAFDINTRRWSGTALDTEMTPVAWGSANWIVGPALATDGTTLYMVYQKASDATILVYQSRAITDGTTAWGGTETTIEDGTENMGYPSVAKKVYQKTLDAVYTTQTTQLIRHASKDFATVTVGTSGTQTASINAASTNQDVGGKFTITRDADSSFITGITIAEQGTVDAQSGLDNIKLYYDLDVSDPYDCASESLSSPSSPTETQFGSTDTDGFSAASGTSAFTGSELIHSTQAMCVYVVLDSVASYTGTMEIQITTPSSDVTTNTGAVSPGSAVAISGTTTISTPQITVSGGCFTDATEGTPCSDDGADQIKVAVNGTVQSATDTTVDGSWSLTMDQPSSGAVLVIFRDGETTESEEATTVVKYDGSGDVTLAKMYQSQLVIGTDSGSANSDQTISIADLDTTTNGYENSDDEDVLFDVTAGADLTVDAEGNKTETLYVISGDTFRPASGGGGDTTTHHLYIEGTFAPDNNTVNVAGDFTRVGTFTYSTSTVIFNGSAAQTISGATSWWNLTINNTVASPDDSNDVDPNAAQTVEGMLTIADGQFTPNNNDTYYRGVEIQANGIMKPDSGISFMAGGGWTNNGTFIHNSGTVNLSTVYSNASIFSGSSNFNSVSFSDWMGGRISTLTSNLIAEGSVLIASGMYGGIGNLNANGYNITVGGDFTKQGTFTPGSGTLIFNGSAAQTFTTGGIAYNAVTINNTGTDGANDNVTISGALDVNGTFNVTNGDLVLTSGNPNVNTAGDVTIGASAFVTKGTGTWTFDGSGTNTWTDNASSKQDLGAVSINGTTKTINLGSSVKASTVSIAASQTLGLGSSGYTLELAGTGSTATVLTNSGTLSPGTNSTVKYTATNSTGNMNLTTTTYNNLEIAPGSAENYDMTGNLTGSNNLTGNFIIGSNATLDTSAGLFMITYDSGSNYSDFIYDITIDGSSNTYVAGHSYAAGEGNNFRIHKYDSNGNLITGWGDGDSGMITYNSGSNYGDSIGAITIDGSGNIFVAGYSYTASQGYDFRIHKYDSNGDLATGWGDGDSGMITYNSGSNYEDSISAITIDGSGNIFVAGYSTTASESYNFRIHKYDSNGDIATGWGDGDSGMITYNSGSNYADFIYDITVDGSGNIFVAGTSTTASEGGNFRIHKYDSNGDIATGWGDGDSGMITYNSGSNYEDNIANMIIDGTGNIYVAGYSQTASEGQNFRIHKYDSNGDLATGWGDNNSGMITYNSGSNYDDLMGDITIDGSGNIFVAGDSITASEGKNFRIHKYDSNGDLATGWGDADSGMITYNSGSNYADSISAITIDGSGNIFVAGYSAITDGDLIEDFRIHKYDSNGDLAVSQKNIAIGGSYTNSGTFNAGTGLVTFNASSAGKTINAGGLSKPFYDVEFNGGSGGWTIQTTDMKVSRNLSITDVSDWTLDANRTLEVDGTYSIADAETTATTFSAGSVFYLNSGSSYTVGSKNQSFEGYATLQIGANTDIRMWSSAAATYIVDSSGSLYSQDHNNGNGDLYIWGDYHVLTNDYWSYATDFDGTSLSGGSERQVDVVISTSATVTAEGGDSLDIIGGDSPNRTTISRQGAANGYGLVIDTGTINAQYTDFEYLDGNKGLDIRTGSTVTSLNYCSFDNLAGTAGTDDAFITVASSVIGNGSTNKTFTGVQFSNTGSGAEFNVNRTGADDSGTWLFSSASTGTFFGEDYDGSSGSNEADPGMINWAVPDTGGLYNIKGSSNYKGNVKFY